MRQNVVQSRRHLYTGGFVIDKITNSIEEKTSGKSFPTEVILTTPADIKNVHKKNGWKFNWKNEYRKLNHLVYKLLIKGDNTIQGLISIEVKNDEKFIEMHLIETAPQNYGKSKIYIGVPGNLVAFACKMSLEAGMEGYVAFIAKSKLIKHYENILGAQLLNSNNRMGILPKQADFLVNSYFKTLAS